LNCFLAQLALIVFLYSLLAEFELFFTQLALIVFLYSLLAEFELFFTQLTLIVSLYSLLVEFGLSIQLFQYLNNLTKFFIFDNFIRTSYH